MMEPKMMLPAIAILFAGVCFANPGVNINVNINVEGGSESKEPGDGEDWDMEALKEWGAALGEGGSGGGPPWGGFGESDGKPCPNFTVQQDFNLTGYLGLWYEAERFYNPFTLTDCVTAHYSLKDDGNIRVVNSNGQNRTTDDTIVGTAVPSEGTEGLLTVSFPPTAGGYQGPVPTEPNYNILMTDYDTYAVVYTCATFKIPGAPVETKMEFGWILSRETTLPEDKVAGIKKDLDDLNIDSGKFNKTNQEGCARLEHEWL